MTRIVGLSIVCLLALTLRAQPSQVLITEHESGSRENLMSHFDVGVHVRPWEIYADTADGWKQWDVISSHSFGLDRGRIEMINDLESLHPYFRDKVLELIRICRSKGIELAIVETYRTPAKQMEYRARGRRYTRAAPGQSKHQYGMAVDLVPMRDTVAIWRNYALWRKIGAAGEKLGLRWGGRWRRLYDPAHFEWVGGITVTELAKGNFPPVPKPENYPCLEEDLKELKRHWKSWQIEQAEIARRPVVKNSVKKSPVQPLREGTD